MNNITVWLNGHTRAIENGVDVVAGATMLGTMAKWLPPLAALASIIWFAIRIYEYARWRHYDRNPPEDRDGPDASP